jgi:hypothetical protein
MDLCYCPFGKTCKSCDKANEYVLTDENGREFIARRYQSAKGDCRFELYNCAKLVSEPFVGAGALLDLTTVTNKDKVIDALSDVERQKTLFQAYTSGHLKRGVL